MSFQTVTLPEKTNLTRLQFLYWTAQGLRPDSPLFSSILLYKIHGAVDERVFTRAHDQLVRASDALRTVVEEREGVPRRRVLPDIEDALDRIDLSGAADPSTALSEWVAGRKARLLRVGERMFDSALIKLGPDDYTWYLNQHHLNADGTSFILVFDYLSRFYRSIVDGKPEDAPELPAFESYIEYEKRSLDHPLAARSAAHWALLGDQEPDTLNYFGSPAEKTGHRSRRVSRELDDVLGSAIRKLAQRPDISMLSESLSYSVLFMSLLTIYLHNITGAGRISYISPVHNRLTPRFRRTVGLLMELCPFLIEVEPGWSFMQVIRVVQAATRDALMNYRFGSDLAFSNREYDVMFNFLKFPAMSLAGHPVEIERVHQGYGTESLALDVYQNAASDRFELHFNLHEDVFNPDQAEHLVLDFVELVQACVEDPDRPVTRHVPPAGVESRDVRDRRSAYVPPRDQLEEYLVSIWESVLDQRPIGIRDDFYALGGTSWFATRLFLRIQDQIGRNLPLSVLLRGTTIESIADLMRDHRDENLWETAPKFKDGPEQPPFFCVPGAAGNLLAIGRLARRFSAPHAFYSFEMPALAGRTDPLLSVEEHAACFLQALRRVQPEGPYFIGGYSWGGVVAFEMAQQLRRLGEEIGLLFIIDVPLQSPRFGLLKRVVDRWGVRRGWGRERSDAVFLALRDPLAQLIYQLQLSWRLVLRGKAGELLYRWRSFFQTLKEYRQGRLQETLEPRDYWDRFNLDSHRLSIIRNNDRSLRKYIAQPYPGEITLVRSSQRNISPYLRTVREHLGWEDVAGEIRVRFVEGSHLGIMLEPAVEEVARVLDDAINQAARVAKTT